MLTSVASNMISHVIFVLDGTAPGPVPAFADSQPVTSIIDTIHTVRALFARQPVGTGVHAAPAAATHHRKIA